MFKIKLHWQILISLILAIPAGYFFKEDIKYITWVGTIFLKLLKLIIVPLILSSIIHGIISIGTNDNLGRLGVKTISYYLTTSILAIFTGLFFVNMIAPGEGMNMTVPQSYTQTDVTDASITDTLMNIVPSNIFSAIAENKMLSVIFISILFGIFINKTNRKTKKVFTTFFEAFNELMMKITMFIMKLTPYGVFSIVAGVVAETSSISAMAEGLLWYSGTVIAALAFHFCLTLPAMVWIIGKVNPIKHLKAMSTPLITAFSTSSSSATLPITINSAENKAGISNKISGFTLPLGATVNMDGTALYELVAAMFIAQALGYDISFTDQLIAVGTALLASIGAAGIPMAGIVMLTIILSSIGLPLEGIGIIFIVDRILDMFRTATNVWSDSCGAAIIAKSEGEKLKV